MNKLISEFVSHLQQLLCVIEDIPLERRERRRIINISRSVKIKAPASLHCHLNHLD